jgi:glycosyltransferase involved in cell wall biosynthesis
MKRKIAFVTYKMITGGVEKALIAMMKKIDFSKNEVDLYVLFEGGELLKDLPEDVNVIKLPKITVKKALNNPKLALRKLTNTFRLRCKNSSYIEQCYYTSRMFAPIEKSYDIAVSYHAPNTVPVFYVCDFMCAKKTILWLHGDLRTNAGDTPLAIRYHEKYDKVFGVSQSVCDSFLRYHPNATDKVAVFYNYIDSEKIKRLADEGKSFSDDFDGFRILTIGRLDYQKGLDMAIQVCSRLKSDGFPVRWYVCGEGNQRSELESMIREAELQDDFILLGNQMNPYGYLKMCDLYVQPSRTEGYCTTTNEARMMFKAVITTDVSGAIEQFRDNETGWIVNIDSDSIFEKCKYLIEHKYEIKRIENNLRKELFGFDGFKEVESILN